MGMCDLLGKARANVKLVCLREIYGITFLILERGV